MFGWMLLIRAVRSWWPVHYPIYFFVNSHESRRKLALCATLSKPLDDLSFHPLSSPCPSYSGMTSMALIEG